jgi:hypothetical protein
VSPPVRPHPIRRALLRLARVLLVVTPVAGLGFFLGLGGPQASRTSPPPIQMQGPPPPKMQVLGSDATTRISKDDRTTVRLDRGETLRLQGGRLAQVDMELTDLPLRQAVDDYDRRAARAGWELSPELTRTVNDSRDESILRVYLKRGSLRLVIIGPPQGSNAKQRPVTVFEGTFRDASPG